MLYPVELRARVESLRQKILLGVLQGLQTTNFGRGGGIRTHDPLLPKQMRYQAALRPEEGRIIETRFLKVNRRRELFIIDDTLLAPPMHF